MRSVSVEAARARLDEIVEETLNGQESVEIVRDGQPAAMIVGADKWRSIQESLFWLRQDVIQDIGDGQRADIAGRAWSETAVRSRFGDSAAGAEPTRAREVVLSPAAVHDIDGILDGDKGEALEFLYEVLGSDAGSAGWPLCGEFEEFHAARRGDLRVFYEVNDDQVLVHRLDHPEAVYVRRVVEGFWKDFDSAYDRLADTPEAWDAIQSERTELAPTLKDGIDSDPGPTS